MVGDVDWTLVIWLSVVRRRSIGGGDRMVGICSSVGRRLVGGGDQTVDIWVSVSRQLRLDSLLSLVVGRSLVVGLRSSNGGSRSVVGGRLPFVSKCYPNSSRL